MKDCASLVEQTNLKYTVLTVIVTCATAAMKRYI